MFCTIRPFKPASLVDRHSNCYLNRKKPTDALLDATASRWSATRLVIKKKNEGPCRPGSTTAKETIYHLNVHTLLPSECNVKHLCIAFGEPKYDMQVIDVQHALRIVRDDATNLMHFVKKNHATNHPVLSQITPPWHLPSHMKVENFLDSWRDPDTAHIGP